jgi:hypothetical protein
VIRGSPGSLRQVQGRLSPLGENLADDSGISRIETALEGYDLCKERWLRMTI